MDPAASRDEAFWQRQQKRREEKLGQPCCTQSGFSWSMMDIPGDFAVVVHGEFDCLNCFHHHTGTSAVRFYSTRLTEEMLTTGRTEQALRSCLELIARVERPEVVLVLGTCPVEVIGDRFGGVVDEVSARTGVPMIPLRTHGLALSSQPRMLDWLFRTLATLPPSPRPEGQRPRINLVGAPNRRGAIGEARAVLGAAGVEVNGSYPEGAALPDWRGISHAMDAFVVDPGMFPRLVETLAEQGQRVHEVPLPIGLGPTLALYGAVAQALGVSVDAAVEPLLDAARRAIEAFRRDHGGLRLAVALRMLNNYSAQALAYDGLGELAALQELGFEVELLVQGPPEPAALAAVGERLRARGCDLPYRAFPGPFALAQVLREGRFQACILADSSAEAARQAGLPMLPTGSLSPWLRGVPRSVELLRGALRGRR